jgi:hypothetical protein
LRDALARQLPDLAGSARVLAWVRPHASRYLAAFVQRTKKGGYVGRFEDFSAVLGKEGSLFRYTPRFSAWREAFGDRFVLRPFIRSELRNGDVVEDFATEILRGAPFLLKERIETNTSPSLRSLSGLRHMHRLLALAGMESPLRSRVGALMSNHYLLDDKTTAQKPQLDRRTAELLLQTCGDDARALDSMFFSRPLIYEQLVRSIDTASDAVLDLEVSAHFSSEDIRRMEVLIGEIASAVARKPRIFKVHSRSRTGLGPVSSRGEERLDRRQAVVARFEARLSELAGILSTPGHGAGDTRQAATAG